MNTKNILVSFLLIASVLLLTATASAANITEVKVDGIEATGDNVAVIAGDSITVKVVFTAEENATDVRLRAEIEGDTEDTSAVTSKFDIEAGKVYFKTLTLEVPADFDKDELNNELNLNIKIWNSDFKNDTDVTLNLQRESYNVAMAVTTSNAEAGETMSVDVVLKNVGYNDADDVFVTVSVPELGIKKQVYFGDIVTGYTEADEDADEDDTDTVTGRIALDIPYSAKSGVYTLQVDVEADESKNTATKEITINNGVSEIAIKSGNDLVLLNPTNKLLVYTVKYNSNQEVVVIPAASSKTVTIGTSDSDFDVTVYSGETLLSTVKFGGSSETTELTSPVFVLTVILAIVFLVLLAVLVVLLTKKPQKAEEFGESYY